MDRKGGGGSHIRKRVTLISYLICYYMCWFWLSQLLPIADTLSFSVSTDKEEGEQGKWQQHNFFLLPHSPKCFSVYHGNRSVNICTADKREFRGEGESWECEDKSEKMLGFISMMPRMALVVKFISHICYKCHNHFLQLFWISTLDERPTVFLCLLANDKKVLSVKLQ